MDLASGAHSYAVDLVSGAHSYAMDLASGVVPTATRWTC